MKVMHIEPTHLMSLENKSKKMAFGRLVNGKEYPDELVKEAGFLLSENMQVDENRYKESFVDCLFESKINPFSWVLAPLAKILGSENPVLDSRISMAVVTLGLSELLSLPEAAIRKNISDKKTGEYVSKVKNCMIDLLRERNVKGLVK